MNRVGGKRGGDGPGGKCSAMQRKVLTQLVHRPPDALLRRGGVNAQGHSDFLKRFLLEVTKHDSVAILLRQRGHRLVQQRGDSFPGGFIRRSGLHQGGLLFALLTAELHFPGVRRGETRGAVEPGGRMVPWLEGVCLARQEDEHNLGDFLRQRRIARLPQRRAIHQADMALHQRGEGRFDWRDAYSAGGPCRPSRSSYLLMDAQSKSRQFLSVPRMLQAQGGAEAMSRRSRRTIRNASVRTGARKTVKTVLTRCSAGMRPFWPDWIFLPSAAGGDIVMRLTLELAQVAAQD